MSQRSASHLGTYRHNDCSSFQVLTVSCLSRFTIRRSMSLTGGSQRTEVLSSTLDVKSTRHRTEGRIVSRPPRPFRPVCLSFATHVSGVFCHSGASTFGCLSAY